MSEIIRYEPGQALTASAPIDRFDELLQQGQIAEALDLRIDSIEADAKEHRTDCEAAKLSAAGLAVAGLLMSASPVIGLLGGLGAVAYGVTLFQDYQRTKKFCPIPAVRKTLPELLTGVGNAADRVESSTAEDPLADAIGFLEPAIAHEYELLQVREMEMQRYLQQFPPAKRLLAYRVALRQTRLRDTLSLPTMQQAATMDQELQPDTAPVEPIEYADYSQAAVDEPAPTDAIDVPATTIQQPAAAPEPPASSESRTPTPMNTATPGSTHSTPIAHLLGDRLRTALITSVSGGGKDIILSNAVRSFLPLYPDFKIVLMDCKDDAKEYGYYDGLSHVSVHRLNVAIATDSEVTRWVEKCLDEFLTQPEKALLICNEGTLIRAKSKRYIDAIAGLVSSGDSRQKYAWEAGQSAHTDDLGINGAARSRFRILVVGMKGEEMQIEAILAAKFVADSARNMSEIKAQMNRSPARRAWCDGQHWYAMPALENHSGYDRDSRSMLQPATPQTEPVADRLNRLLQQDYQPQPAPAIEISNCPSDAAATAEFIKIAELSRKSEGFISASKVKSSVWKFRAVDADKIREVFLEMHRLGVGKIRGSGASLEWSIVDVS